ncbi:MAG: putative transposase [Paraburkholderia sp.]|jgi:transposase-like protein|uniref:hypothetical protein n=1 Tax=Paraburkholderia sp. TaxID=1926495 RepID=UPI002AFE519F|nr:hypothetical protein [Paraburkholderia sp.]MEA3082386.1 putative transposase [Paraburkholderia sp.]
MKADGLLPEETTIRPRTNVMLGFKRFRNTAARISGIELMHRVRKGQFNFSTFQAQGYRCARCLECRPVQSIRHPYL